MTNRPRHIRIGLVIVTALLAAGETRLGACSCGARAAAACQAVWNSEAVFVASVASVGPVVDGKRLLGTDLVAWPERLVTLKVTEAFRGVEVGDLTVRTAESTSACGFEFEVSRAYVVFADRDPASGALTVSYCSNTGLVEESADELAYLRGPFRVPSDLGEIRGTIAHYNQYEWVDHPAPSTPFPGAELRLEGYSRAYTTTSGADGTYKFAVPAGEYRLFVRVRDGVFVSVGADGYPITLKDNRGCAVANMAVRPDSRISGRLLDSAGRPVPFMSVEMAVDHQLQESLFSASKRTLTDVEGRFEFKRLEAGTYTPGLTLHRSTRDGVDLAVWLRNVASGPLPIRTAVEAEGRVDLGDVRLPPGVSTMIITGVVETSDGKPVAGAQVRFGDPGPYFRTSGEPVVTDDAGRFALSAIAGRTYRLTADWSAPTSQPPRYLSAKSDSFAAVGDLSPFRLVVTSNR